MSFRKICGLLACLSLLCCMALLPAHAETSVTVTDAAYGANGSDTKDDTAAIQKALDLGKTATTANPLVVNVPAGTYYISSELKIYSNTTLKLDAKATIVRSNDATRMLASGYGQNTAEGSKGGYGQLQNVTITGGTWDGNVQKNGSGQGSNPINLMTLWHGRNITFSSMTMKSVCGTHFVEFNSIDTLRVTGVTFQDFVPYSGLSYDYTTVADGDVADKVEGVSVYSEALQLDYAMQSNSVSAYPYDKTPCKNVTISGCTFRNCLSGVGNHHSDVVSTNITISGNTFTNMSASCINLPNMTGVTVSGNTATNVRAFLRASYGTEVTVSNNTITYGFTSVTSQLQQDTFNFIKATATLTGNKVYGTGKRAVIATDGTVTLDGNTFDLTSFRPNGYNAVQMGGTQVRIVDNTITNAASTAIDLLNVKGATGFTQVEGNAVTTTGSQGIRLEGCDGLTVKGNTVKGVAAIGVRVESSTDITVSGNTIPKAAKQAISIEGSSVTADNNVIETPGENGIVANASSTLNATGNTITGAKSNGISVTGSTATLTSNKISGCTGQGIRAEGSTVTASSNTITAPGGNGLLASGGSTITTSNNTITDAGSNGVSLTDSAAAMNGDNITGSEGSGIRIADTARKVTVSGVTVSGVTGSNINAVYVSNAKNVILSDCTVTGATAAGIRVVENSNVTIRGCEVKKAATMGINVADSTVTITGTTVSDPGQHGIYLNGATFAVTSNTITGVTNGYGIRIVDSASTVSSGTLLDNAGTVSNAATGEIIDKLETPMISSVSRDENGILIEWNEVFGAYKYRVLLKSGSGEWETLVDTYDASYVWTEAEPGSTYTFTVRCIGTLEDSFTSDYDTVGTGFEYALLEAPRITSITRAAGGVTITWGKVADAAKYRVFYKADSGWKKIVDTADTAYTWTEVEFGKTYSFTVRCVTANGSVFTSDYDTTGTKFEYSYLDTPKITEIANADKGVKITWGKVDGAEKYRVFYKADGGWKKIADTAKTTYTWTAAAVGTTYSFTVRCVTADGSTFSSKYDTTGTKFTCGYVDAPKISSITKSADGVKITWGKVDGAVKYRVFYKNGSSWKKLADTADTTYTWTGAVFGQTYSFTVRCVSADGSIFLSSYDTVGTAFTYDLLSSPKISSVSNVADGVKITWGKVTGAAKYRVFYKNGSGWKKIADTADTTYTWTGAKSGTSYTFTVRCISADGSAFTSTVDTTGKSIIYLAAPKISGLESTATGVKITWGKVTGAAKYRVFYKANGSGWTQITDVTGTSYTWTGAKSGTKYTFTVRCVSADGKSYTSAYDTAGKSITYLAAPKISSVENVATGVKITWGKVTGAAKYRVFYKTGSGSWKKIADTADTSYTWTGAQSGTAYSFTVRCVTADGSTFTSAYDTTGKSITYLAAPKISGLESTAGGVKITWGKVTGAVKYRIFYKANGSGWTQITDVTGTSYTWTGAKSGTKYTFTVRCVSADGKSYTSSYDSAGKSLTVAANLTAPKLSSVENVATGVKITWGKVTGAAKYRVFYKTGSDGWKKIADTTATSYTWTGVKSGTKYTFTVRCVTADGSTFTSSYDTTGKSITYIAAPKLSSVANVTGGVKISWSKVTGAAKYRVFYKTGSGSWTKIADTTDASYTWTGAKSGTAYTFTVRCVSADGSAFTSAYDTAGLKITH